MSNAKEFLMRLTYQKYILEQTAADVVEAENDAYGLSAVLISERVQTSSSPEWAINAAVAEVERLKRKYDAEMKEYIRIRKEVKDAIRSVPERKYEQVLELRYCRFMRLSQIAETLDRNEAYIRRMHGEALESFRRVHKMS